MPLLWTLPRVVTSAKPKSQSRRLMPCPSRAFEQIRDHRHKRGLRYPLAVILSLVVLGKLAGMTSLAGIAEWVCLRADWRRRGAAPHLCQPALCGYLRQRLAHRRGRGADPATFWLADTPLRHPPLWCGTQPTTHPSGGTGAAAPCRLRWQNPARHTRPCCSQTGVVLAQQAAPDKGNEITVEATLLTPVHVHGHIVTADARHTQRTCCLRSDYPLWRRLPAVRQGQAAHAGGRFAPLLHGAATRLS